MRRFRTIFTLFLLISLNTVPFTTQAFLLPGNVEDGNGGTNGSSSSLGTFLAASGPVGENRDQMGSSERKDDKIPKVDVIVTPSHPRPNDVIYAQALAQNFRNSPAKLYYNWYIYNSDPKVGSTVVKNGQKSFIPSNTLEGALIRGAIAQVRGSYLPGVTPKAKDLGKSSESVDQDKDGYSSHFGGDDGQGAIEENIKDILGDNYDFSYKDFTSSCKQNCDVEYKNAKSENDWKYDKCSKPTCSDWLDSCCNGAKSDFDSCVNGIWDTLGKTCFDKICDKKNKAEKNDCYRTLSLDDYNSCNSKFFNAEIGCSDDRNLYCLNHGSCGAKPAQDCIDCEKEYHTNQWKILKDQDYCNKKCEVKENNFLGSSSVEPVGSRCFRYNFGSRDAEDHLAGIFQPVTCTHYFPGAKNPDDSLKWKDLIPFTTGDNSFKEDEEIFWGSDPTNADTDGDGFPDEADVVGEGQQSVQYQYQQGDKIGVVVEGTSLFPTNEKTSYYKTMWANLGVCNSEVVRNTDKETPEFNNFCRCDDRQDGQCKKSEDFGFGYLQLNDIWQDSSASLDNNLEVFINHSPLRPTVNQPLNLEAIVSGNELDKDLLSYEWTIKHGGEVLKAENDVKNSRIVWKKQGTEVAYTKLDNQLADFKEQGGVGWQKLNFDPLIEGDYDVLLKTIETNGNKQKLGEATLKFTVNENLKIRFFRGYYNNSTLEKRDELTSGETIPGDKVIAEYDGPYYDDFAWYIDKKKIEGNNVSISLAVEKSVNSFYNFKLVASNKNHTDIAEDESPLKVINPYVTLKLRNEAPDKLDAGSTLNPASNTSGLTYQVPTGRDLEFVAVRNPAGSSFAIRDDLHYFWSLDESEPIEGKDSFQITLDESKYGLSIPHNLEVKIYNADKKLLGDDKITLIPVKDKNAQIVEDSQHSIGGLAFAYLNLPEKMRFLLQTLVWVFLIYLLLRGIAWIAPMKKIRN